MTNNLIVIQEDDYNKIVMYKDSYKGIIIQLIRKGKTKEPEVLISSINLPCVSFEENLKSEVRKEISILKQQMNKIQMNDIMIEGIFQDYRSIK